MRTPIRAALAGLCGLALLSAQAAPGATRNDISWDTFGVPHVHGRTEADVFRGFGWAQAKSHANVVLHLYGEARGKAAEYWGQAFVESDRWVLSHDIDTRAARWYEAQPASFRQDLDAFAQGINDYARGHPDAIDPSVRQVLPVSGIDVVAHAHRLMNYIYIASPEKLEVKANGNAGGSNAWAVMPSKSKSGRTLLLANPHLPWSTGYFTYYEAQLQGPGIDMYGATQVGLPVLRFMFNERLGFTNTVNEILGSTTYLLTLSPAGDAYRFDGKLLPLETRSRRYRVLQADGSMTIETLLVRSSVHGPVFTRKDGRTVALRVAGLDRPGMLRQYWDMGRAANFEGFQRVLRRLQVPMFNIVYGDRDGHVMYLDNGILPKHAAGDLAFWRGLVPGDTSATLWTAVHDFADLPKVIDPPGGFVQNANDPPWLSAWPQAIRHADFPPYVAPQGPVSLRAQMSVRLLQGMPKIGFDDFVGLKLTTRSLMADRLLPELLAAAEQPAASDPDLRAAVDLLRRWDHSNDADSRGALLFETWAARFASANFAGLQGYAATWSPAEPIDTPRGLKHPDEAVAMLKAAIGETRAKYGALDRPFGEVSRFHIDGVNLPGNGGFGNTGIFRTITWGPMKDGQRTPLHGETWVSMVEFGTPLKAVGMMSYGNASQPGSPHRGDQLRFLSDKTFRTLWTTRAEVQAHLEETTGF